MTQIHHLSGVNSHSTQTNWGKTVPSYQVDPHHALFDPFVRGLPVAGSRGTASPMEDKFG
jgi:hypothetical protein